MFYPSGLTIPAEGCWRLSLRSGSRRWTLHVRAITPPAEPRCDTSRLGRGPNPDDPGPPNWVAATPASSGIFASFSIPGVDGAAIYAGGLWPNGANTKILWLVTNGHDPQLRIRGVRLDGLESFRQSAPAVSPAGVYPSIVVVPTPGCWLIVSRSGSRGGAMVVRALVP